MAKGKLLERLTAEQLAQFPAIREEWIRVGLSTERADRPAAEAGARAAYAAAGLEPPRYRFWIPSPMGGAIAQALIRDLKLPRDGVWDGVRDGVRAGVRDGVWDGVWAGVRAGVWAGVGAGVWAGVWDGVGAGVWDGVRAGVGAGVGAGVWDGVWAGVWDGVWDGVGALPASVRQRLGSWGNELYAGQHEAAWLSFYDTFRRFGLKELVAPLDGLTAIGRNAGWAWFFRDAVILTERPLVVHVEPDRRGANQLHCETGPAIAYPDGWAIWSLHGIRVPRDVVEAAHTLTPAAIHAEPNVEVRRVMIERFGHRRYLHEAGAIMVHKDDFGTLWQVHRPDDSPLVMVQVVNSSPEPDGSFHDFFLRVNPQLRPMHPDGSLGEPQAATAVNAVASTFGLRGTDYAPGAQS